MRLTWHHEADVVVLSLWRGAMCAGTFRLATADVDSFVDALVDGLRDVSAEVPHPGVRDGGELLPANGQPAGLPPRQRRPVTPATQMPETGQHLQPAPAQAEEGGFTDWAFGPRGRHGAAAS